MNELDQVDIVSSFLKNFHNSNISVKNFLIQEVLQESIIKNSWILQICQLSLSKSAKKLIMHSFKKKIDIHRINLYLQTNLQHLYSKELHHTIQTEFNNTFGVAITLNVIKSDVFLKKTPMEYIFCLYAKKILKLKQELSADSNIKMIQCFLQAKYSETDIELLY